MVGAVPGLLVCSWYHKRMLERRRAAKNYSLVPGEELDEERDVELGETGAGHDEQGAGVVEPHQQPTVTEELDNWDENADDWDEDETAGTDGVKADAQKTSNGSTDDDTSKKRDE